MLCRPASSWLPILMLSMLVAGSDAAGQQSHVSSRGPRFLLADWSAGRKLDASTAPVLRRRVSLDLNDVTIGEALKEITRQADLEISYSPHVVPLNRPVSLHAQGITIAAALTEILVDVPVDVSITAGGGLALVPRSRGASALADTGTVIGQVSDSGTGLPIVGATVSIDGRRGSTVTDAGGRYRIAGLAVGTHTVRARYIGYRPASLSVTVTAQGEAIGDLSLTKAAQQLEQVVVTGTIVPTEVKALPTPISVITADDIAQQRPQWLSEVIRRAIPTAVAFDPPSQPVQTAFAVRGASSLSTGGSLMKIFVDGVEATNFGLSPVDPSSIERIEVVRGPQAATIYGADAAGGVIQIFTKRGNQSLTRPEVDAQAALGVVQTPYDGFGGVLRQQYSGSIHGGGQGVSYNLGGGYTRVADYLPNGEFSRHASPSIYGGMHFTRGPLSADLSARYYVNKLPLVINPILLTTGFSFFSRPLYQLSDFTNETYGARITIAPTGWWRNLISMGVDRQTQRVTQTRQRLTTPADTLYTLIYGPSRKVSLGYTTSVVGVLGPGVAGSVTAGLDHYDRDVNSFSTSRALNTQGTILTSPPGSLTESQSTVRNTGYFAQAQLSWREAIFLTGGLRAERNSTFGADLGTPVLPRLGLSLVQGLGPTTVKLRGSYGRAIRAPSAGQTFGSVTPTQINLENPLLGPEQQHGWDAGVDLVFGEQGSLSVTVYDQKAKDLIVFVQVASTPLPTFQFQNIGRVSNKGVEVEGTVTVRPLQLTAQYGYVRSLIQELGPAAAGSTLQVGDHPMGTPAHTAGAGVTFTPFRGTTLTAGATYVGSFRQIDAIAQFRCFGGTGPCQPTDRDYIAQFPAFTKVDAALTQQITGQVDGFISVGNVTNNEAYEGSNTRPVVGRTTMVGLHLTY